MKRSLEPAQLDQNISRFQNKPCTHYTVSPHFPVRPPPPPQPSGCPLSLGVYLFWTSCTIGITDYVTFCDWPFPFGVGLSRLICVVVCRCLIVFMQITFHLMDRHIERCP